MKRLSAARARNIGDTFEDYAAAIDVLLWLQGQGMYNGDPQHDAFNYIKHSRNIREFIAAEDIFREDQTK